MPVKFTPLALSVSLASPMIFGDKLHHSTLAEPPHTHELPKIPGQTISVSSPPISGSNVSAQSWSMDAFVADSSLVLLGDLRAGRHRRGDALCTVFTGTGTAYVLAVGSGAVRKTVNSGTVV